MNILIACEFSGIVRNAFIERGHDAVSCDLIESETKGPHLICDVSNVITDEWDMMIAHPPCTYLVVSGNRWMKPEYAKQYPTRQQDRVNAIQFFMKLINAPIDKKCIENPVGIMSTEYCKPTQYIQPWQFGHGETKKTGLWLKNLPTLVPSNIVDGRADRMHRMGPSKNRCKNRSRTYTGIAEAMADQWG